MPQVQSWDLAIAPRSWTRNAFCAWDELNSHTMIFKTIHEDLHLVIRKNMKFERKGHTSMSLYTRQDEYSEVLLSHLYPKYFLYVFE